MGARERLITFGLILLMLITWLGFTIHESNDFAGSLFGSIIGIIGAFLMLIPLFYLFIKRIPLLKSKLTKHVSMKTMLNWHIYAGIIGPILVLIHTGHKFQSSLGIALTGMTLIVAISGYIGRYLMGFITDEVRDKKVLLSNLEGKYQILCEKIKDMPSDVNDYFISAYNYKARIIAWLFNDRVISGKLSVSPLIQAICLAESIADVEYSIKFHEYFKLAFSKWLKLHIIIAMVLYILLALHIWSGIYFGLRWL